MAGGGTSTVRRGSFGNPKGMGSCTESGCVTLAVESIRPPSEAPSSLHEIREGSWEVHVSIMDHSVVSFLLLSLQGRLYGPYSYADVRRVVGGTGDVAQEVEGDDATPGGIL